MHLYLSSYQIGNHGERLSQMVVNKTALVVSNALDFSTDTERINKNVESEINSLSHLGIQANHLDLREYFNRESDLATLVQGVGMLWVHGGNTFLLRQAMRLSGLDNILLKKKIDQSFVYGGFSAGVCVLSPSLKGIHLADEPEVDPIGYKKEIIWEGLGLIDYYVVPHYRCDHFESHLMEAVADYYNEHKVSFKCIADGEVITDSTHKSEQALPCTQTRKNCDLQTDIQ